MYFFEIILFYEDSFMSSLSKIEGSLLSAKIGGKKRHFIILFLVI